MSLSVPGKSLGVLPDAGETLQYNLRLRALQQAKEIPRIGNYQWLLESVRGWSSCETSSQLMIDGEFSDRFEMKVLCVDIVEALQEKDIPVVWVMRSNPDKADRKFTVIDLIKHITTQLLQISQRRLAQVPASSISAVFQNASSRDECLGCLELAIASFSEVYIVIDAILASSCLDGLDDNHYFWPMQFLNIFKSLEDKNIQSAVKTMFVSYGRPQTIPDSVKAEWKDRLIILHPPRRPASSVFISQKQQLPTQLTKARDLERSRLKESILRTKLSGKQADSSEAAYNMNVPAENSKLQDRDRPPSITPNRSTIFNANELQQAPPQGLRWSEIAQKSLYQDMSSHHSDPQWKLYGSPKVDSRPDNGRDPSPMIYESVYPDKLSYRSPRSQALYGDNFTENLENHGFNSQISEIKPSSALRYPRTRNDFEIALICALRVEFDAVEALFDEYYEDSNFSYGKAPGDPNAYTTGRILNHNVVLAFMPGIGKANSAGLASSFRTSFNGIKLGLVVGICGGVPQGTDDEKEIILGDIIISSGIVQFDFGRQYSNRVIRKDTLQDNLGRPDREVRALLTKLSGSRGRKMLMERTSGYLTKLNEADGFKNYAYPGAENDILYRSDYRHKHQDPHVCSTCAKCRNPDEEPCQAALESSCEELLCHATQVVTRARVEAAKGTKYDGRPCTAAELEEARAPWVHFGLIASGDSVMKSGYHRDEIAARENVIAFEMEGAGVWDVFPTVIIKSVCDYADSHKNKRWQKYAAATAACCMKAFLSEWRYAN